MKKENVAEFMRMHLKTTSWLEAAIILLFGIGVPLFYFIFLTMKGQVFGTDSWYWLTWGFKTPLLNNIVMVMMWLSVFMLFGMVRGHRQSPYLIAAFFVMSLFSTRLLEVELKDYAFFFAGFLAMVWAKNNIKWKGKAHIQIGLLISIFYLAVHNFFDWGTIGFFMSGTNKIHTEVAFSPMYAIGLAPAFYLMMRNASRMHYMIFGLLVLLFTVPKFLSTGLIFFVFGIFLEFVTMPPGKEPGGFKWNKPIMIAMAAVSIFALLYAPVSQASANEDAFERLCNPETMTCHPDGPEDYHYGHYFAYKGYMTDNPEEFGTCWCQGDRCLEDPPRLRCGPGTVMISQNVT